MSRVNMVVTSQYMLQSCRMGFSCQNSSLQHWPHHVFRQTKYWSDYSRYLFPLFQYLPQHAPFLSFLPSACQWSFFFVLSPQKFMYYIVIRICSDFWCKMHPLKMHGWIEWFLQCGEKYVHMQYWSCVYCLVNMFMYFNQCNISEKN